MAFFKVVKELPEFSEYPSPWCLGCGTNVHPEGFVSCFTDVPVHSKEDRSFEFEMETYFCISCAKELAATINADAHEGCRRHHENEIRRYEDQLAALKAEESEQVEAIRLERDRAINEIGTWERIYGELNTEYQLLHRQMKKLARRKEMAAAKA